MADKQNAAKAEKTKSAAAKTDKKAKKPNVFVRAFRSVKNAFSRLAKYFRDVKSEMKKVVWPGKKQIINNTIVVLVVVAIAGVVTLALDTSFISLLKLAIGA